MKNTSNSETVVSLDVITSRLNVELIGDERGLSIVLI